MLRATLRALHGKLTYPVGSGSITLGETLLPLLPSNNIFYNAPKLRHRLDKDGYLYLKNVVPREVINAALDDLANQMRDCGWTLDADRDKQRERDGFAMGVPYPGDLLPASFHEEEGTTTAEGGQELPPPEIAYSEAIRSAVSGTSIMAAVRQVFGGAVTPCTMQQLHLGSPGEAHPFRMNSVFYNKGTKLSLFCLVPLQDTPMHMGTPVVVRGSNSTKGYEKTRKTYGQWEVEDGDIFSEDGAFTADPEELLPLGKCIGKSDVTGLPIVVDDNPLLSSALEAGDVLLFTVYTMAAFLENQTTCWRIFGECCWTMEGDDVGPDPRYMGDGAQGLARWHEKRSGPQCDQLYPRSLLQAKKDWGLFDAPVVDKTDGDGESEKEKE